MVEFCCGLVILLLIIIIVAIILESEKRDIRIIHTHEGRYCPHCGRSIDFNAKYCTYCGKRLD